MPALQKYRLDRIIDLSLDEGTPTEPIDLTRVKAALRITFTDDDTYLTNLIPACRKALEEFCCISLVEKDIIVIADVNEEMELPYGPVSAFTSARYKGSISEAFSTKTLNTDYYIEGITGSFQRFAPAACGRWELAYTTGYATVPNDLLLDLERIIAYCFEHRGDEALTSLQGGQQRPKSLDEALELFAGKHRRMFWT